MTHKQHANALAGIPQPAMLPMTPAEMTRLGWKQLDILLVSGDAYVDHPSFGAALLGRWLVRHGYRVGIVAQPRWDTPDDVARMGRPRLFAGVTAGCLDSMLAHYTAFRKKRSDDAYTPGGLAGNRPNRATIAYTNAVRRAFPGLPVVLGGIEASLRRISHYDFWSDAVRRSVLLDSKASAILYGMAEVSLLALADGLSALGDVPPDAKTLRRILAQVPGAVFAGSFDDIPADSSSDGLMDVPAEAASAEAADGPVGGPSASKVLMLPSHEAIVADPRQLLLATRLLEQQVHQDTRYAVQPSGDRLLVLTPPGPGLDTSGLDLLAGLPFSREPHPSYTEAIPAAAMIHSSVTTHRGCAGGCSFCTLALHQGRRIRSRSRASILAEVECMAGVKGFTGSISDVGGPSANMWGGRCAADPACCERPSCLAPGRCKHFLVDQQAFVQLLRAVSRIPAVRHVRVASGWRMDLGLADKDALGVMVREFVGGQAKVAPEHMAAHVLRLMRKPPFAAFEEFLRLFACESAKAGKEQYVVPYLMSAAPGCTDEDMRQLAQWLGALGWKPSQVQCFIPLPGTAAAAMYHACADMDGKPIHVAKTDAERLRQHGVLVPTAGRGPEKRRHAVPSGRDTHRSRTRK